MYNKIFYLISLVFLLLTGGCGTDEYEAITGGIDGIVLNAATNAPVKGCEIITDHFGTKHTDESGRFSFENVTPGLVNLTYRCNGFETATRAITVQAGQLTAANISLTPAQAEASLRPNKTLLDFGNRTSVLDLVLTNTSKSTAVFTITTESDEIKVDPSRGSIVAGKEALIKVSVVRDAISEGHYEKTLTITVEDEHLDIQIVFDKGNMARPSVSTLALSQSQDVAGRVIAEGAVTVIGSSAIISHGFCYSSGVDPTLEENDGYSNLGGIATPKSFTGVLSNLELHKEYRVRAYATNSEGTGYGDVLTITLKEIDLTNVITGDATNLTSTSATLAGSISEGVASDFTKLGFHYGLTAEFGEQTNEVTIEGKSSFVGNISGLTPDTDYYYCAYGVKDEKEYLGAIKTFRTLPATPEATIVCKTVSATNIQPSSITFNGEVTTAGGKRIKEWGFFYGTTANPSIRAVGKTYDTPYQIESTSLSLAVGNLEEDQEYNYCLYVVDEDNGVVKGNVLSCKTSVTPSIVIETLKLEEKDIYHALISGKANLYPQGKVVMEAGFIYEYPSSNWFQIGDSNVFKIQCEIVDNSISCEKKLLERDYKACGVRAYMVLSDGTVVYSGQAINIDFKTSYPR